MPQKYQFELTGTFGLDALEHVTSQVRGIPNSPVKPSDGSRYVSYDDHRRRQFKGQVMIIVEEVEPLPAPEPEAEATDNG